MAGVPVYDERGELFAPSVIEATQRLGCRASGSFSERHLEHYRDGYQLRSRPDPRNTGRRGGPRIKARPIIGPSGERWKDSREAAAALGIKPGSVRRLGEERDGALYLRHYPSIKGVNRLARRYREEIGR